MPETVEEIFAANALSLPEGAVARFSQYLALLQRWNQRINLTAIREPGQIIRRHFLEGAFTAAKIPSDVKTLLDFGSGAGIPGIPIAICRPEVRVTLAEAHSKKAVFLQEVIRSLQLTADVHAGRVEAMAAAKQFDAVTMRAVEKMETAVPEAAARAGKYLVLLTSAKLIDSLEAASSIFSWSTPIPLPNSEQGLLVIGHRQG